MGLFDFLEPRFSKKIILSTRDSYRILTLHVRQDRKGLVADSYYVEYSSLSDEVDQRFDNEEDARKAYDKMRAANFYFDGR